MSAGDRRLPEPAGRNWIRSLVWVTVTAVVAWLLYTNGRRINPEADAAVNRGIQLSERGKLEEAIAQFRDAIRLAPEEALAHFNLGVSLERQGKLDEAIAAYSEAIRLRPGHVESRVGLGAILSRQGKFDEAVVQLQQATQLGPGNALAHHHLGFALHGQGKPAEAIAEFREAIRLGPANHEIHRHLGIILLDQKQLDEAVAELREAIRLAPDVGVSHLNLANALINQGKLDQAIPEFREAIRLDPDDALAPATLAFELLTATRSRRDHEEALGLARKANELNPQTGMLARILTLAEYRTGHWAECIAAADRAAKLLDGGDASLWFMLSVAHAKNGDKQRARNWFDNAVGWTKENAIDDTELRELWKEAAPLLDQPGPDAGG